MDSIYIKRYPAKGENPAESDECLSSLGLCSYDSDRGMWWQNGWQVHPEWWLEEIKLPTPERIVAIMEHEAFGSTYFGGLQISQPGVLKVAEKVLSLLTGEEVKNG